MQRDSFWMSLATLYSKMYDKYAFYLLLSGGERPIQRVQAHRNKAPPDHLGGSPATINLELNTLTTSLPLLATQISTSRTSWVPAPPALLHPHTGQSALHAPAEGQVQPEGGHVGSS